MENAIITMGGLIVGLSVLVIAGYIAEKLGLE